MLRFTLPAAALAASTLLFSFNADAADHRDHSRYDRQHDSRHDNDRRYNDSHRDHRYDNHSRWSRNYTPAPRRYYWNDGRRWRYGYVPSYFHGRYYAYPPRDSRGRLIITIPF